MSRLNKVITENMTAQTKISKEKRRNTAIPQYGISGKVISTENKLKKRKLIIAGNVFVCLALFLYIPGLFMKDNIEKMQGYSVTVDPQALKLCDEELSKSPNEDFDHDGIDNSKELIEGTNPWNKDTDFDGTTDYYELYVSKTNAYTYDDNLVINYQKQLDSSDNKNVSSPYKMDNVILWAADYNSKALGGVIETSTGYHFYKFNGYAQFPEEKGKYAYGVKNNKRTLLNYLDEEKVWKITGYEDIEIYNEPLEEVIEFKFFSKKLYSKPNVITKIINFILPEKGFITATKKTVTDIEPDTKHATTVSAIVAPDFEYENTDRFSTNTNSLANLQYVREMINNDRCIAVSLFDENDGEYIGIVYGYTYSGNLLIADYKTLQPVGEIEITEIGRKMINNDGVFTFDTLFAWKVLGFSSSTNDRISFFAVSMYNGNALLPDDESLNINEETSETTEATMEETTEATMEETTEATIEETTEATMEETSTETSETINEINENGNNMDNFPETITQ